MKLNNVTIGGFTCVGARFAMGTNSFSIGLFQVKWENKLERFYRLIILHRYRI